MGTNGKGHRTSMSDGSGSTSWTYDSSGGLISTILYYPWGGRRWSSGSIPTIPRSSGQVPRSSGQDYQYTDQRIESNWGIYFYNARWYDPYLNRWIQPDSIVPDQSNSQSYDRYAYAFNNPVRYTDPTGHRNCEEDGYNFNTNKPMTVTDKALNGDISSAIELIIPTHGGIRGQIEVSGDIGVGFSGTAGINLIYNRLDNRLEGNVDYSLEPGAGISATGGIAVGWESTNVSDATSGYSGILSATADAEGAGSVAI